MSFFLVFLALLVLGAAALLGSRLPRMGASLDGLGEPMANLPPVLLPDKASPADVDRVRFSLGLRGYRMDQVDEVLDNLRDQLARKDEEIRQLRNAVAERSRMREEIERPEGPPGAGDAHGSLP